MFLLAFENSHTNDFVTIIHIPQKVNRRAMQLRGKRFISTNLADVNTRHFSGNSSMVASLIFIVGFIVMILFIR